MQRTSSCVHSRRDKCLPNVDTACLTHLRLLLAHWSICMPLKPVSSHLTQAIEGFCSPDISSPILRSVSDTLLLPSLAAYPTASKLNHVPTYSFTMWCSSLSSLCSFCMLRVYLSFEHLDGGPRKKTLTQAIYGNLSICQLNRTIHSSDRHKMHSGKHRKAGMLIQYVCVGAWYFGKTETETKKD